MMHHFLYTYVFWENIEKSSCKPCLFISSPSKNPVENSLAMFVGSKRRETLHVGLCLLLSNLSQFLTQT